MPTQPLTHHEILGLVEPFARRDRHVDLASSDRLGRCLVFKAIEHAAETGEASGLRETLKLHNPEPGLYRLTRVVTLASGLNSSLEAEGPSAGALLTRIETVDLRRGFQSGPGYMIAQSHFIEAAIGSNPRLILKTAVAHTSGLTLALEMPTVRGYPAELELKTAAGDTIEFPEDLLAVLGRPWTLLDRKRDSWQCRMLLRGREPSLSRLAEQRLQRTAEHLAQTLGEPPNLFHERFQRDRFRVMVRRAVPLLVSIGLVAGAAALSTYKFPPQSTLQMLLFNAPPLLMVAVFSLRELPRIEIPPIPRPLKKLSWRQTQAAVTGSAPVHNANAL
jgi:hypothetical protein